MSASVSGWVGETIEVFVLEAAKPLVAGPAADAKALAQFGHGVEARPGRQARSECVQSWDQSGSRAWLAGGSRKTTGNGKLSPMVLAEVVPMYPVRTKSSGLTSCCTPTKDWTVLPRQSVGVYFASFYGRAALRR